MPLILILAACAAQTGATCSEISERVRRTEVRVESLKSEVAGLERVLPDIACDEQCNVEFSSCLEASDGGDPGSCYRTASQGSKLRMDQFLSEVLGSNWQRPQLTDEIESRAWESERTGAFRGFVQRKHGELAAALNEHASALSSKLDALSAGRCSDH